MADDAGAWRFRRALARVEPAVDRLLADYATAYWQRPLRRELVPGPDADGAPSRVTWTIDREPVVDFVYDGDGRATLHVHDYALVRPIQKAVRTGHVRVQYGPR
jgi:hypothetical protein